MNKKTKRTRVSCIQCPNCGDIIYSRAHHDCNTCSCGDVFIDGGFSYTRYGAKDIKKTKVFTKYVSVTRKDLYDDWAKGADKYGFIK